MMKKLQTILFFFLIIVTASAQKQTYLLFAYGQKSINDVCGEKLMLKKEEIAMMPAETFAYRNKLQTEMRTSLGKGYTNVYVELVPETTAVIFYEGKRVYTQKKDGWDCTNTFYGCIKAKDMLAAEKAFAAYQAEYKNSEFKEVFRWGKSANSTPAAIGENDLDVQWKTLDKKQFLQMTNTRKDVALQVTIVQYKQGANITKGNETDLSKMIKTGETTITLEPGSKSQNSFDKASGFEIRIIQKAATPEEQGLIDKVKQIIKSYVRKPDGSIGKLSNIGGVRG
ncbi:hypothetical protein ACM55F_11620 [Flavobacterium sp. XS2P12]|uniref:hypothetical protein n=1 Tax=Flavobacterium melibiosi TaxID=3398734 RepID=UPI003A89E9F9